MSYKSKRSRATDIPPKVKALVYERDNKCCVICGRPGSPNMHYISRNNRGLGIEQNVVTGCIECHTAYDNGSKKEEIGNKIKKYLQSIYGDSWNEYDLIYNKWQGFKYSK